MWGIGGIGAPGVKAKRSLLWIVKPARSIARLVSRLR
jgi:hypothetical protein